MDRAVINIKIETDGQCGYYASIIQAFWFVTLSLMQEEQQPLGKLISYKQKDYRELQASGVKEVKIRVRKAK